MPPHKRFIDNPYLTVRDLAGVVSAPSALQSLDWRAIEQVVEGLMVPQTLEGGTKDGDDAELSLEQHGSVYIGLAGLAHLFVEMALQLPADAANDGAIRAKREEYLQRAAGMLPRAIKHLHPRRVASFLDGKAGGYALLATALFHLGQRDKAAAVAQQLCDLWEHGPPDARSHHRHRHHGHHHGRGVADMPSSECELLCGRAGYLYALLYVHQRCGADSNFIPPVLVQRVVADIMAEGERNGREPGAPFPLTYFWHDSLYLGAAHGVAGILLTLLYARELFPASITDAHMALIRATAAALTECRFPDHNYPSSFGSRNPDKVHWCHGAPGFIPLLLRMARHAGKGDSGGRGEGLPSADDYLHLARQAAEVVWEKGLLLKGVGLCHGIGGNGLALLTMYRETNDEVYLHRARAFALVGLDKLSDLLHVPDRPFSLFEGVGGLAALILELQHPHTAHFLASEL